MRPTLANLLLPRFLTLDAAQLVLVHIVTRRIWLCLWFENTLYLAAVRGFALFGREGELELIAVSTRLVHSIRLRDLFVSLSLCGSFS